VPKKSAKQTPASQKVKNHWLQKRDTKKVEAKPSPKKTPTKRVAKKTPKSVELIQNETTNLVQSALDAVHAGQEERNQTTARYMRVAQEEHRRLRSLYEAAERRPGSEQQSFIEGPFPDTPNFENIMLRAKSRALMRNNSYARAIRDFFVSRMCPPNLAPDPTAILDDGTPDTKFNEMAKQLWEEWSTCCLIHGGNNINEAFQMCGREIFTTGEVILFHNLWTTDQRAEYELPVGYQLVLKKSEELDNLRNTFSDANEGNGRIFQGVQVDQYGKPTHLYLRKGDPFHWLWIGDWSSEAYPIKDFTHAYVHEAPGQYRGISHLASCIDMLNQIGDLQFNAVVSSTIQACFSVVIKTLPHASFQAPPPEKDENGNYIEQYRRLFTKPGMAPVLRVGEEVQGPEMHAHQEQTNILVESLLRGIAVSYPIKPSALTGNYNGTTYSSEASCAIETFPRRQASENFFISHVAAEVYKRLIKQALIEGYFGSDYSVSDARKHRLFVADWPQAQYLSINPGVDVKASIDRAASNLSNFTDEAIKWGSNARDNMRKNLDLYNFAKDELGYPEELLLKMFSVPFNVRIDEKADLDDEELDTLT
jgi:lambda family phage portal protein